MAILNLHSIAISEYYFFRIVFTPILECFLNKYKKDCKSEYYNNKLSLFLSWTIIPPIWIIVQLLLLVTTVYLHN